MQRQSSRMLRTTLLMSLALAYAAGALAADNWKRGRVYYRMTCTACHKAELGEGISPSSRTIAEWKAYLEANRHAAKRSDGELVTYYTSRDYRESVKESNLAASKFLELPDEQLAADVRAFLVRGAKDSDTPMRCE